MGRCEVARASGRARQRRQDLENPRMHCASCSAHGTLYVQLEKITNPREKWERHQYSSTQAHKCREDAGTASRGAGPPSVRGRVRQSAGARQGSGLERCCSRRGRTLPEGQQPRCRKETERARERKPCRCTSADHRVEKRVAPRSCTKAPK